jgi:hypothetical protein
MAPERAKSFSDDSVSLIPSLLSLQIEFLNYYEVE